MSPLAKQIRLENTDCLALLKQLPDKSVDLVLVDPPYFRIVADKWDRQWKSEAEYLAWCREWATEANRVLKEGGCFYVWGTTKTDTFLRFKLDVMNQLSGLVYQNWIIWSYDWGGRTKKTFARKHEDLLMYSKGEKFLFDADAIRIPYKMKNSVRAGTELHGLGKIPTDVWEKNNHTTSKEYVGWHPTQKPISLLERIIRANTPADGVVLDFFSGSGSTAIASQQAGRQFIGCELDRDYFEKSLVRIEQLTGLRMS